MKLKNLIFFTLTTVLLSSCSSNDEGPVFEGDMVISTIEDYNKFNFEYVFGTLTIENLNTPDLSKLSTLKDVGGSLIIRNCGITSLNGLENLETINTNLIFENNENLETICCLDHVERVESLQIIDHPSLTSIEGLSGLRIVNDTLRIRDSRQLASLNGLQRLETVNKPFILNEAGIQNLDGLQSLEHVETLYFNRLDNLVSAVEWGQLMTVDYSFKVENCGLLEELTVPNLVSLPVLFMGNNPSLIHLNFGILSTNMESVSIGGSPSLQTLRGLDNVFEMGELYLINLESLEDLDGFAGLTYVTGNLSLSNLDTITTLSGFGGLSTAATRYNPNSNEYTSFTISSLDNLISLDGLSQLQTIGQLVIEDNSSLNNLDGTSLQATIPIGCRMYIENNSNLSDYCGLSSFVNMVNINSALILENAYNPTIIQIGSGTECSL